MEVGVLLIGWGWAFAQMKSAWLEIEDLGFDVCYFCGDDLFAHPDPAVHVYDPWTVLPVMADTTMQVKIGPMVSPAGRRHPGLFAKMTTNVDIMSGGRLIVGMGAGNTPEQQRTLNQPYPGPTERTDMLREELTILKSMWTQSRTSFEGTYYRVYDAINEPKPVSQPHPEILVALGNKKFLPPVAAEFATRVNLLGGDDHQIAEVIDVIAGHCKAFGRSRSDIIIGRPLAVLFTDGPVPPERVEAVIEDRARLIGSDPGSMKAIHRGIMSYVGPPSHAARILALQSDLGVSELDICVDTIAQNSYERTMEGIRLFASHVLPGLKSLGAG